MLLCVSCRGPSVHRTALGACSRTTSIAAISAADSPTAHSAITTRSSTPFLATFDFTQCASCHATKCTESVAAATDDATANSSSNATTTQPSPSHSAYPVASPAGTTAAVATTSIATPADSTAAYSTTP